MPKHAARHGAEVQPPLPGPRAYTRCAGLSPQKAVTEHLLSLCSRKPCRKLSLALALSFILILPGSFVLESCPRPLHNLRKTSNFYKGTVKLLPRVLGKRLGGVLQATGALLEKKLLSPLGLAAGSHKHLKGKPTTKLCCCHPPSWQMRGLGACCAAMFFFYQLPDWGPAASILGGNRTPVHGGNNRGVPSSSPWQISPDQGLAVVEETLWGNRNGLRGERALR